MASRTLYSIRDLSIGYGDRSICKEISFDICEGDCMMLCGANGSGKTTLMKALTGLSEEVMMIPARIIPIDTTCDTGIFTIGNNNWSVRRDSIINLPIPYPIAYHANTSPSNFLRLLKIRIKINNPRFHKDSYKNVGCT